MDTNEFPAWLMWGFVFALGWGYIALIAAANMLRQPEPEPEEPPEESEPEPEPDPEPPTLIFGKVAGLIPEPPEPEPAPPPPPEPQPPEVQAALIAIKIASGLILTMGIIAALIAS